LSARETISRNNHAQVDAVAACPQHRCLMSLASFSFSPARCLPFHIRHGDTRVGCRMFGNAPSGVVPGAVDNTFRYFATFVFAEDLEISLFISGDTLRWIKWMRELRQIEEGNVICVAVHGQSSRGESAAMTFPNPPSEVVLHEETDDKVFYAGLGAHGINPWLPRDKHKIGGEPHIIHAEEWTEGAYEQLKANGIHQVLQLDMSEFGRAGPGNGLFHLFGTPPRFEGPWCWLLEA
jgi:hypothetical protein